LELDEVDEENGVSYDDASVHEFAIYITSNAGSLVTYGERYGAGERISSCSAESTVNAELSKRFAKRQKMQWAPVPISSCKRERSMGHCGRKLNDAITVWVVAMSLNK